MIGTTVVLRDKGGRNRVHVYVRCGFCQKTFPKPKRFIKKQKNHFCDPSCQSEFNKFRVSTKCAICGKLVERKASRSSKSGLVFCCREHKELAQSHKGQRILRCGADTDGYRLLAFAFYGEQCEWCDEEILKLLDVHHIDHNRDNNEITNLIVLCVRCHAMETRGLVVVENRKPRQIGEVSLEELLRIRGFPRVADTGTSGPAFVESSLPGNN